MTRNLILASALLSAVGLSACSKNPDGTYSISPGVIVAGDAAATTLTPILCKAISAKAAKTTGVTNKQCQAISGALIPVADAIATGSTAP